MGDLVCFDAASPRDRLSDLTALGNRSRSVREQSRQLLRAADLQSAGARQTHLRTLGLMRHAREAQRARCGPIFAMADIADQVDAAVVLAALIDTVEDYAVCTLDPVGGVVTWNVGAYRIKGYAPDEVVGRHFSLFFVNDDVSAGKPQQLLAQATANGRTADQGWRVRKDRSRFWASVIIVALLDGDGSVRGYLEVTRDDSERHLAEGDRRELETLREQVTFDRNLKDAVSLRIVAAQLTLRRLSEELHDPRLLEPVDTAIRQLNETINDLGLEIQLRGDDDTAPRNITRR